MQPARTISTITALHAGLAPATQLIVVARRRAAIRAAVNAAVRIASIGLAAGASLVLLARLIGSASAVTYCAAGATVATAGIIAVRSMSTAIAARRDRPSPADVAQRLDLACDDANRIATALDLAEHGNGSQDVPSPFTQAAIADGLAWLTAAAGKTPVLPTVTAINRKWTSIAVAAAVTLGVVTVWPIGRGPSLVANAQTVKNTAFAATDSVASPAGPLANPLERPPTDPARRSAAPQGDSAASPAEAPEASVSATKTDPSAESSSSAATGRGSAVNAGASAGAKNSSAGAGTPAAESTAKSTPPTAADRSADASTPSAPTPGAAATGAPGASPGNAQSDRGPGAANAAAAQRRAGASPKSGGEPQNGDGQHGNGAPSRSQSTGDSSGANRSDAGQGSSSGQSPPKKARGVPPLMLGTRQPDVLIGQPLAGPDERKMIDVPPQPKPPERFDGRVAPDASIDESPTDPYRVPADDVAAAACYFEKFHAQPTTP